MAILLMRHGPTQANRENIVRGQLNFPLAKEGHEVSQQLAQHVRKFPLADLKSSDMRRSMQTAHIVQQHVHLPVSAHPALRPWNLGSLAGQPHDKVAPIIQRLLKHPATKAPGGESFNDFAHRVLTAMIPDLFDQQLHGVVAHGSGAQTLEAAVKHGLTGLGAAVNHDGASIEPGGMAMVTPTEFTPLFRESKSQHGIAS